MHVKYACPNFRQKQFAAECQFYVDEVIVVIKVAFIFLPWNNDLQYYMIFMNINMIHVSQTVSLRSLRARSVCECSITDGTQRCWLSLMRAWHDVGGRWWRIAVAFLASAAVRASDVRMCVHSPPTYERTLYVGARPKGSLVYDKFMTNGYDVYRRCCRCSWCGRPLAA